MNHVTLKRDWCHMCGFRGNSFFTEFDLPKNAEHSTNDSGGGYHRFCDGCVKTMASFVDIAKNELKNEGDKFIIQ